MASSIFPSFNPAGTVDVSAGGGLSGDGSSGDKLEVAGFSGTADTQVLFNDGGTGVGGSVDLTWDGSVLALGFDHRLDSTDATATDVIRLAYVADGTDVQPSSVATVVFLGRNRFAAQSGSYPVSVGGDDNNPNNWDASAGYNASVLVGDYLSVTAFPVDTFDPFYLYSMGNNNSLTATQNSAKLYVFGASNVVAGHDLFIAGRNISITGTDQAWFGDPTVPVFFTASADGFLFDQDVAVAMGMTITSAYKSADGSTGMTQDVTAATLVGKTMTFKNGLLVGFA